MTTNRFGADTPKTQPHGSTTNAGTTRSKPAGREVTGRQVEQQPWKERLLSLVENPISSAAEAEHVDLTVREMSRQTGMTDAKRDLLQAVLNCYPIFVTDEKQLLRMISLYLNELAPYPDWSVKEATIWWLSRHNPDRKRKPLPGDLSEICEREMTPIRVGQKRLQQWMKKNG